MWNLHPNQRVVVYKALVHGIMLSNAEVYMPHLTQKQYNTLQVAGNMAFRATLGLRTKGKINLQARRKKWRIPTIKQLYKFVTARAAHKNSEQIIKMHCQQQNNATMTTRACQVVKTSKEMGKFLADQVQAWNSMSELEKKARSFPRRSTWNTIMGCQHGRPPDKPPKKN